MAMPGLRLGVMVAVFDQDGCLLLTQRSDLGTWTLPGGRLDAGEALADAAVREVQEETGLEAALTSPLGLYMLDRWQRMNVLFAARVVGGALRTRTDETRASRFLGAADALTRATGTQALPIRDALSADRPPPRRITARRRDHLRVRARLGVRYVWNWMRGKPEPRYPHFTVSAIALVWDAAHRRVLTQKLGTGRALPRIFCDGHEAPWDGLRAAVRATSGVDVSFAWVGVWEDAPRGRIEFVFAATVPEQPLFRGGEWTSARSAPLPARDALYVARVGPGYASEPAWMLRGDAGITADDIIAR